MRSKEEIISLLTNPGIIAIVRIRKTEQVQPITEALVAGGVNAVEITTTTPNAIETIREISKRMRGKALIGVGTVLDCDTCRAAVDAGAQYIVSPICRAELVSVAHAAGRPVMLGAYTPTEAQLAHEAGSDFIKIFPADTLGAKYIKALRAPLPHLRLVPTGGIDARNIGDFFRAGCTAVGIGSSLVSADLLQTGDWAELTRRAVELVRAAGQSRSAR